jgi:hypothetical protein
MAGKTGVQTSPYIQVFGLVREFGKGKAVVSGQWPVVSLKTAFLN